MDAELPAFRRSFRFRDTRIGVSSNDPTALAWLERFLCPWFESTDEPGDYEVRYRADDDAYGALEHYCASGRGKLKPCFSLDTSVIALPSWERDGAQILHDSEPGYFVVLESSHIEVVTRCGGGHARIALMRVLRELTCTEQRRAGGVELHAAAFSLGDAAVLVAGPKGAGKTTVLSWAVREGGAKLLANDRLFAFLDAPGPVAMGMPTIVSVRAGTVERFPRLGRGVPAVTQWAHLSNREFAEALSTHGPLEAPCDLRLSPEQFMARLGTSGNHAARIVAVLFPEVVAAGDVELTELSGREAVGHFNAARYGQGSGKATTVIAARVPTSGASPTQHVGISRLAASVPCYRYALGRDAYDLSLRDSPLGALLAP